MGIKEKLIAEIPHEFKGVHEYMDMSDMAENEGHHHIAKILKDEAHEEFVHGCMMMEMLKDMHHPIPEELYSEKMKAFKRWRD